MRTEYITTKVRPIKKLFIIEQGDYASFAKLFLEIQDEIDAIQNLIFVNDNELWSQSNKDFIKRSDPDIIINLSKLDDNDLSIYFGIFSVNPITDNFEILRFGTNLFSFTRLPTSFVKYWNDKNKNIVILSATKLDDTAESLFACLNYGLIEEKTQEHLLSSIFKGLKATYLTKKEEIVKYIFDNDKKFTHLTTEFGDLGGSGYGSSIYEINYNKDRLFYDNKKYFFISDKDDFKTITFFWNTRSYYQYSNMAWIPIEFLTNIKSIVDSESVFVCFTKSIEKIIKKHFPSALIIQPTQLYFMGKNERWNIFKHEQIVSIANNEVIILHPSEKSFSDMGLGGAFVLETSGLREFIYPKRRRVGNLFFPKHYDLSLFEERFLRISECGLSKYILQLSPMEVGGISERITLPMFNEVIKHLFEDIGYRIKPTKKTSILEQTVNLLGGVSEICIISFEYIFDLLVSLTPKIRTEKIIEKILGETNHRLTSDNILEIIVEIKENGAINFPSVILTIEEILAKIKLSSIRKNELLTNFQKLYDKKVLLRGKYFKCLSCHSHLWIQLDQINRINYCTACNNIVDIPIHLNDKQSSDHFRLNQLIVSAIDQGQLSEILLINFYFQQQYRVFDYLSNIEVFKEEKLITDIDLVIRIGKRIGIAECKSTSGFEEKQVDELINIAMSLQCDFISFSTLVDSNSPEIKDLVDILNKKSLSIPAFILSKATLFQPKPNMIQKHFELWHADKFTVGPIIVV
jgi:hypothetical protein